MESNSQLPYNVVQEGTWSYSFLTSNGLKYYAYFIDMTTYHPDFKEVYTFIIEPESKTPHPIDNRISITISSILHKFFMENSRAMIMVCDSTDGKEKKRKNLFDRWFVKYAEGDLKKYDASVTTEDYQLYVSIFVRDENPRKSVLISAFYELVKNDFIPIQ